MNKQYTVIERDNQKYLHPDWADKNSNAQLYDDRFISYILKNSKDFAPKEESHDRHINEAEYSGIQENTKVVVLAEAELEQLIRECLDPILKGKKVERVVRDLGKLNIYFK
jgi:hypothetical protein